ncbi:MAG: hypothetical protein ACKVP7_11515 [Hyphomicrobiaceae bacterium]
MAKGLAHAQGRSGTAVAKAAATQIADEVAQAAGGRAREFTLFPQQ